VPIGLTFEARKRFRGRVLVSFGEPVAVSPYLGVLRHQLRFGALLLTRAQKARRLLAERREIVEELERAKRDSLRGSKGPSF